MTAAAVNKIVPLSVVDGPGNRTAVFLQGCNIACAYCHNPETQNMCISCGECVRSCPAGALTLSGGRTVWDSTLCRGCDRCIASCRHSASPKVTYMTAEEVMARVMKNRPFIRGISVSGGECMLRREFLTELFTLARAEGLGTLIDSNGTIPFAGCGDLLAVTDGVMLDVKCWDPAAFRALTGGDVTPVKENLVLLAQAGKIQELRIVCAECEVDVESIIRGVAETIPGEFRDLELKLIRFRRHGVRGRMTQAEQPSDERMEEWKELALATGFTKVTIK